MVDADRIKEISFWAILWLCFKEAWKTSWEKSDTATAIAGAIIGAIIHFVPQWERAMTSMLWEIPIAALASIVLMRLLLSPFMIYRKRDMEAKLAEKKLAKAENAVQARTIDPVTGLAISRPVLMRRATGRNNGGATASLLLTTVTRETRYLSPMWQ